MTKLYSCLLVAMTAAGVPSSAPPAAPTHAAPPQAVPPGEIVLVQSDSVAVTDAWARASAGAATTGAAYITLKGGAQADQLTGVSTPVAATAQVHQTTTENGIMKMRPVPSLPIPAGQTVAFAPGGTHVMLMGLTRQLMTGQSFPLTLTFSHAPPVTVDVRVQPLGHGAPSGDHGSMHMH